MSSSVIFVVPRVKGGAEAVPGTGKVADVVPVMWDLSKVTSFFGPTGVAEPLSESGK